MESIILLNVGQLLGVGLLFRWLQVQSRDNKVGLARIVKESYTKQETKEVIDMKQKPIEVGIIHVQDEIKELKHMIGRLLDEKNK